MLSNGSGPGFESLDDALAINDSGQIIGFGTYTDGTSQSFLLDTAGTNFSAPDNGDTLLLLAASLGILAGWKRRVLKRA